MRSPAPEPEQLSLPAINVATVPQPTSEDEARIADLLDRLDLAEARMSDAIAHIRQAEAEAQRGRARAAMTPRLWFRRLAGLLLCQTLPPSPQTTGPRLPRLSVVTVTQGERTAVERTIESVTAQNYPAVEMILVDLGANPDESAGFDPWLAARIQASGRSPEAGFALGLARATGDFLTVLWPGDRLLPGALRRVGPHAARHPADRILVSGRIVETGGWRFAGGRVEPAALIAEPTVLPRGVFVRRHEFDLAGGLDVAFGGMPAPALWPRLLRQHPVRVLPGQIVILPEWARSAERELPLYAVRTALRPQLWRSMLWRGRLTFPVTEAGPLPIDAEPPPSLVPARCPITGRLPPILLFSSCDTRLGPAERSEIWYHPDSHSAAIGPPLDPAERRHLAMSEGRKATDAETDDPTAPSPFRRWRRWSSPLAWLRDVRTPPSLARSFIRWTDPTERELRRVTRGFRRAGGGIPRLLEVDCRDGTLLDRFKTAGWDTAGTALDAAAARARGHEVWAAEPLDLLRVIPAERRFDLVFLGQVLERQTEPLMVLQRAARLLAPGGILVVSTANLDSAQIDCFGPSWAHWHPPFHRFVLSRAALRQMAAASGLDLVRCRSFSHPYWSWLSLRLNDHGLAAAPPPGTKPDAPTAARAATLTLASRLLFDWRGRGDYLYVVLRPAGQR